MKSEVFFCCIILTLCSCMSKTEQFNDFLNQQLGENYSSFIQKYTYVVIIPRTGCHSCVEHADTFFDNNKMKKDYLFIFTKLVSEKQLRIELGSVNLSLSNVIVDKKNLFYSMKFEDSEYPLLLKKEGNHFVFKFLN